MARVPIIAVADDLTGAAEIAAIGHRHGLAAAVVSNFELPPGDTGLVVFDTDTRLDPPAVAAEKLAALARVIAARPPALVYKKTDSVLRGAVRVELESLASGLGRGRIVLVSANPALGRTVRDGRYSVGGVPLHETTFAHDPHHPAATDSVRDLLGPNGTLPVAVLNATDPRPTGGIIAGNATSSADLVGWARGLAAETLPAGGGEFFAALLAAHGFAPVARPAAFSPGAPTLIISGTASSAGKVLRDASRRDGVPIVPMPAEAVSDSSAASPVVRQWITALQTQLSAAGNAVAVFDGPHSSDPRLATAIRTAFADGVRGLVDRRAFQHLVVEGGATAATITRALGWHELRLAHEWATGVASLRPAGRIPLVVTMKPGSYAWPSALWQHVLQSRPTPSTSAQSNLP